MNSVPRKHESRLTITQRQLWVMLLAATLLVTLLSVIYFQERSKEWQLQAEQTGHRLALAQEIIARDFERVQADLLFVATLPEVTRANEGDEQSLQKVAQVFESFVTSQKTYSQVRLLGRRGMEITRVNWDGDNANVTPEEDLQDKSDRYYVTDSFGLKPGQIFTSEFDLNLENGQLERPLQPVIRFVTPVNRDGQAGNLLVFNYQGASLLDELSAISLPDKIYLIRKDGAFLLGPVRNSEWGWLLDHSNNFASLFSDVGFGDLITSDEPIKTASGLFHAKEILFGRNDARSWQNRPSLFCIAHIENDHALESSRKLLNRLLLVGGIMLVPLALITRFWMAAIDRRELQNRRIAESEQRLRQLTAQLVGLQEEERKNLSREIHDSLGQQATAINLDLRMLKGKLPESPELERLIGESDELLGSLHGFATRVRPAELDDLGLEVALESHVSEFTNRTGIEAELTVKNVEARIDSSIAAHLFRIVQESLNNIAKHSGATLASVKLNMDPTADVLRLQVSDDGVGLKSDSMSSEGVLSHKRLGILGVKERVDLLGGTIELNSSEGQGTKLSIAIPVPPDTSKQSEVAR